MLPHFLGKIHPKFQTPSNALLVNMAIGIIALLTGKTSEIITISVFGALTLYIRIYDSIIAVKKKRATIGTAF